MKRSKGSKVKKLLEKKDESSLVEPMPESVLATEVNCENEAAGNEVVENEAAGNEGPAKLVVKKDPWQQAFADDNTILIKRTVRSGQCIQFDGNVVVMGDVNPGSEIIASGNIVVMGALRGVVHAGATGNEEATVSAFKLQPTQLRIANHITRAPDGDYPVPEHPEIARIKDGVVVIEIYQLGQDRQIKIC